MCGHISRYVDSEIHAGENMIKYVNRFSMLLFNATNHYQFLQQMWLCFGNEIWGLFWLLQTDAFVRKLEYAKTFTADETYSADIPSCD